MEPFILLKAGLGLLSSTTVSDRAGVVQGELKHLSRMDTKCSILELVCKLEPEIAAGQEDERVQEHQVREVLGKPVEVVFIAHSVHVVVLVYIPFRSYLMSVGSVVAAAGAVGLARRLALK